MDAPTCDITPSMNDCLHDIKERQSASYNPTQRSRALREELTRDLVDLVEELALDLLEHVVLADLRVV